MCLHARQSADRGQPEGECNERKNGFSRRQREVSSSRSAAGFTWDATSHDHDDCRWVEPRTSIWSATGERLLPDRYMLRCVKKKKTTSANMISRGFAECSTNEISGDQVRRSPTQHESRSHTRQPDKKLRCLLRVQCATSKPVKMDGFQILNYKNRPDFCSPPPPKQEK